MKIFDVTPSKYRARSGHMCVYEFIIHKPILEFAYSQAYYIFILHSIF